MVNFFVSSNEKGCGHTVAFGQGSLTHRPAGNDEEDDDVPAVLENAMVSTSIEHNGCGRESTSVQVDSQVVVASEGGGTTVKFCSPTGRNTASSKCAERQGKSMVNMVFHPQPKK